nr:MAG TPA: hypothetical protein [Caudoviricetes sp.]
MKIASQNNVINSVDFATVVAELENKYRNIFWTIFEGEAYIYKALGRRDFRKIVSNENLSTEDKKDEIIKACIVYPEDFDIDDCIAGLINVLYSKIMEVSYLSDEESKVNVIEYYRQDMYSLDNQITCLINEAFPNFDIEEIENWDLERTAKYLSRAEYKLQNFRGFEFNEAYFQGTAPAELPQEQKEETAEEVKEQDQNKKEKLTPERLRQLQAQFPEIDWANDTITTRGIEAMQESTLPPALRAGMF